jgi:hypothetical protein
MNTETLQQITPLTEEQRLEAREHARALVIKAAGTRPDRAAFRETIVSEYPAWFTRVIALLMGVVFVAAAMPSLFRLFTAGRQYFAHGITDPVQGAIVGVSTFLLAEALIILSTIAARVYFTGRARAVFIIPIGLGLAMALVGNWTIARPSDLFGWLETVTPPVAVLFLALVGEKLVLDAIHQRHASERAYSAALAAYEAATRNPEEHPQWRRMYAAALREALKAANSTGAGSTKRKEQMSAFTSRDWSALVGREMAADEWFVEVPVLAPEAAAESNGHSHEDFRNAPVLHQN